MKTLKKTVSMLLISVLCLNGCKGVTVCSPGKDCELKAVEKPSDTIFAIGVATFLVGSTAAMIICKKTNSCNKK